MRSLPLLVVKGATISEHGPAAQSLQRLNRRVLVAALGGKQRLADVALHFPRELLQIPSR
jgi:hypothetical protein